MDKKKFFLIGSLALATALVGGTFAAYAVTDGANPFDIKVTPATIEPGDDGVVHLEWGDSTNCNDVTGLEMNTLAKVGTIGLVATPEKGTNYTGKFSIKITEETVNPRRGDPVRLTDLLELTLVEGDKTLDEVEAADKIELVKSEEDGVVIYSANIAVAKGLEKKVSLFVKIATENVDVFSSVSNKVCNLNINWDKADNDIDAIEYYLVGTFTKKDAESAGWDVLPEYKLAENNENPGEYYIKNVEVPENSELKIRNPYLSDEEGYYAYSGKDDNFKIGEAGKYDFYFNPKGNADWGDSLIYCQKSINEEQPSSIEDGLEKGFYLVGDFSDYKAEEGFLFTANAAAEGEYYLNEVSFEKDVKVKVYNNETDKYYPEGLGNDIEIKAGKYNIYFRPDGKSDWEHTYIYYAEIKDNEEQPSVLPSEDNGSSSIENSEGENTRTFYFIDNEQWNQAAAATWAYVWTGEGNDKEENADFPGVAMTHVKYDEEAKTNTWKIDVLDTMENIIFARTPSTTDSTVWNQTVDLKIPEDKNVAILDEITDWKNITVTWQPLDYSML